MRTAVFLVILSLMALAAGCASSGGSGHSATQSSWKTDAEYVARVEQVAKMRGVRIAWVNPPLVRLEEPADQSLDD